MPAVDILRDGNQGGQRSYGWCWDERCFWCRLRLLWKEMGRLSQTLSGLLFLMLSFGTSSPWTVPLASGTIVAQNRASSIGLERVWFTQAQLDHSTAHLKKITIQDGTLFAITDRGVVQAIDAETGRTFWTAQIGPPDHPILGLDADTQFVAVVQGHRLRLLRREDGQLVWETKLRGTPGAAPAMSKERIFLVLLSGLFVAYDLPRLDPDSEQFDMKPTQKPPWVFYSAGSATVQPLVTSTTVFWPTNRDYSYACDVESPGIRFRFDTTDPIVTQSAYRKPFIYTTSLGGYVYAVHQTSGQTYWRLATGGPIREPPVAIDDRLYVCPDGIGMLCLSIDTGEQIWRAPEICQFSAASSKHVYATDKFGSLVVLDVESGVQVGLLRCKDSRLRVVNRQTDRIYLATDSGLIQCLREPALTGPIDHLEKSSGKEDPETGEQVSLTAEPGGSAEGEPPPEGERPPDGRSDIGKEDPFEGAFEGSKDSPFGDDSD